MNSEKKSFMFYLSWFDNLNGLSDDLQIQLYKAIMRYAFYNEIPNLHPMLMFGFNEIKAQIDRDNDKWEDKREKRRQAGILGNQKRWGNESQKVAKVANAICESQKVANIAVDVDADVDVDVAVDADVDVTQMCVCDNKGTHTPTIDLCIQYAESKGYTRQQAEKFFYFHDGNGWRDVANWKSKLTYWCKKDESSRIPSNVETSEDREKRNQDNYQRYQRDKRSKMPPKDSKELLAKWMKENGYTTYNDEVNEKFRQYCLSQKL